MGRKASPIGDVLKNVFSEIEKKQEFSEDQVIKLWKDLTGETGFRHSRPEALKKKALTVRVDNSAWMQELVLRKRQLLKGLKGFLEKIKSLKFISGSGNFDDQNS